MPSTRRRAPPQPVISESEWKNVIVLGGSYGGARATRMLAESLPKGYRLILVEKQSHFNHLYVFPRYTVVPHHEHKAFIPYPELNPPSPPKPTRTKRPKPYPVGVYYYPEPDAEYQDMYFLPSRPPSGPHLILHASVESLQANYVTLSREFPEHGLTEYVPYVYLVYALGSVMPQPLIMPPDVLFKLEGVAWMVDQNAKIRKAKQVVVVGGGALGIQYASDIAEFYPSTRVTLIHSRPHLLPRFSERMHPLILAHLQKLGIDVILGDRLLDPKPSNGKVHTLKGREVECDYLILCTGQKPNTSILAESFAAAALSPLTGHVTVLRTMQIALYDLPSLSPSTPDSGPGESMLGLTTAPATTENGNSHTPWPNIFAVGDAADAFGAIKAGHTAYYQAEVAARNILRLIAQFNPHFPVSPLLTQPFKLEEDETQEIGLELEEYALGPPAIKLTVGLHEALVQDGDGVRETECAEDLDVEVMWRSMGADPGDMWD
ncbi:FAD/NADP-binding domain-containing protein [Dacryopinax primogenitus]|uniref:FAD/NADP-binding domain-containing protein n=1 Tax=Dacryopinax primogenitus (strain DJM 731) TaxID=1858805 RepID=M5GCW9_DACPD|nr:FAD/NADP-binding domain-containing protein [Dacryopinax primogenitus]EJU06475.1 FAD/NADP-binding domain-containing protein [Dacryopinax primogenitus]